MLDSKLHFQNINNRWDIFCIRSGLQLCLDIIHGHRESDWLEFCHCIDTQKRKLNNLWNLKRRITQWGMLMGQHLWMNTKIPHHNICKSSIQLDSDKDRLGRYPQPWFDWAQISQLWRSSTNLSRKYLKSQLHMKLAFL